MCGRYTLQHSTAAVATRYGVQETLFALKPRYNIAPSQQIAVVTQEAAYGVRYLEGYQWGLVPFWAREPQVGQRLINARAESVAEKPAFKSALSRRRCIIPADGFYEWLRDGEQRLPFYFVPAQDELFSFAGLWEEWQRPDGSKLRTCAILTTEANRLVDPVCTRMPVILRPQDEAAWLDPASRNVQELQRLLRPYPNDKLVACQVSQRVNSAHFDDPGCIAPIETPAATFTWLHEDIHSVGRRKGNNPKRRCVRRDHVGPGGQIFFNTKSFSHDDGTRWHPVVDIETGPVYCDCPDFHFRHAKHDPDVLTPQHWCKHVARAVQNCKRHGELHFSKTMPEPGEPQSVPVP